MLSDMLSIGVLAYDVVALVANLIHSYFAREIRPEYGERRYNYPVPLMPLDTAYNYLDEKASKVWDMSDYYRGRCGGSVLVALANMAKLMFGIYNLESGLNKK